MSLPLLGAGMATDGPSAVLDLNFASLLSLTPSVGPTPSFTRASTGTYFDASGVLTTAAINGPRFDHVYNGSSWVSKGLLIEEARTNLTAYSEQFDNAYWSKTRMTVLANSVIGPDNQTAADLLYPSTGTYSFWEKSLGTISNPASYTISIFLKYAGKRWAYIYGPNGSFLTFFDVQNGVIGTVAAQATLASITNVGNGWYRCVVAFNTANPSGYCIIGVSDSDGAQAVTGSGTDGVYAWGSQFELGAFPTSYIPTTTTAVTRSADVCQITGGDFSGFYNQSEGSFAVEFDRPMVGSIAGDSMIYIAAGSGAPSAIQNGAYIVTSGNITAYGYVSAHTYDFDHGSQLANTIYKIATGIRANDFASSLNGAPILTDNSGTVGTNERLLIGYLDWSTGVRLNGHIARLRYFNARLINSQLVALST